MAGVAAEHKLVAYTGPHRVVVVGKRLAFAQYHSLAKYLVAVLKSRNSSIFIRHLAIVRKQKLK